MIFNILVVLIGSLMRWVSHAFPPRVSEKKGVFHPFVDRMNDTPVRRLFSMTIPAALFFTVSVGTIYSFVLLLKDEHAVPIYALPETAYRYLEEKEAVASEHFAPKDDAPSLMGSSATEGMQDLESPILDTAPEGGVESASVSVEETVSIEVPPSEPLFSEAREATSLTEFLTANDLDTSFEEREKVAIYFDIEGYKGTAKQNSMILERLKALTMEDIQLQGQNP
jgi:hypothetical protein